MRTIVVGDVQGCLDELRDLMRAVSYRRGEEDRLILAGDLLDRGPDSAGVVQWAMDNGAEAVMGNHESSHLRFRAHELKKIENPAYKNPMRERPPGTPHRIVYDSLTSDQWAWLERLPNYLLIGDDWAVVHAGCLPGVQVDHQEERYLQRLRYIERATGKMAQLDDAMTGETHAFWTELWTGPRSIVYGHHVDKGGPVLTLRDGDVYSQQRMNHEMTLGNYGGHICTLGIDTGACFGGRLTAAVFEGLHVTTVSVPARKAYESRAEYGE